MAELKGLCMKCRDEKNKPTMQDMTEINVEEKEGKGGTMRYSAKGKCASCGGNMFKFLSKDDADKLR
jgi:hypothetical protein